MSQGRESSAFIALSGSREGETDRLVVKSRIGQESDIPEHSKERKERKELGSSRLLLGAQFSRRAHQDEVGSATCSRVPR
jgi:hypothetical protein